MPVLLITAEAVAELPTLAEKLSVPVPVRVAIGALTFAVSATVNVVTPSGSVPVCRSGPMDSVAWSGVPPMAGASCSKLRSQVAWAGITMPQVDVKNLKFVPDQPVGAGMSTEFSR